MCGGLAGAGLSNLQASVIGSQSRTVSGAVGCIQLESADNILSNQRQIFLALNGIIELLHNQQNSFISGQPRDINSFSCLNS